MIPDLAIREALERLVVGVGGARHRHHDHDSWRATAAELRRGCGISLPGALTLATEIFASNRQRLPGSTPLNVNS